MSTPKEIFLELIRPDGQPERQLRQYEALHMCLTDPCNTYLRGNRKRGTTSVDRWGTTILFPEDAPGPMPDTREGLAVCPDVTRWRETVHAPDLEAACTEGWDTCRAEARAACGSDHLLAGFMGTGIFEQCHFLMGFEDTLTNLYAHPDEMHALIDYITEYRLTYVRMLIDHLQPDVIFSHDDWGTKNALFMKPEMWREFFKEPYRRFYGYIRSRGVIAIHHADSYLVPIVDDMAEIGIQVWQGVLPENDIPALQRHLNGRIVLMGGFGAAIDRKDATPEDILTYARDVLKRNCPGGHYIPSITYGLAGTVYPHVDKYLNQAVDEYNAALHVPVTPLPPVPRRSVHAAAAPAQSAPEAGQPQGDVLSRIASALVRGQQKRVLQLCAAALEEGKDVLQSIADYYMWRNQCPRAMGPENIIARKKYIFDLAEKYRADGIIVENMKFCEYWGYERAQDGMWFYEGYELPRSIPVCQIEKDYTSAASGQLRTRFQAFIESLEIKKIQAQQ